MLKGYDNMFRRSVAVFGLAFVALLLLAPAASAQYPNPGIITVDNPNPDVGDTITVNGTTCDDANVTVTISLTQGGVTVVLGQTVTGPDGSYTISVVIPDSFTAGPATLTDSCGGELTLNIGAVTGVALPRTGSDSTSLFRVAVALVAAGGVLVLGARKRSAKATVEA
jgi:LPXTG-motif cell wall-anchored protein